MKLFFSSRQPLANQLQNVVIAFSVEMAADVSKKELELLIHSQSSRITFEKLSGKHSTFDRVLIDGLKSDYCKCSLCPDVYIVKYKTGSQGLLWHENSAHKSSSKRNSDQPTLQFHSKSKLNGQEKEKVFRASTICCAMDLLPLNFTENEGVIRLVDTIASICHSKQGLLTADEMLGCHRTNLKYSQKCREDIKYLIVQEMKQSSAVHTTCDHWEEAQTCRDFFTVTAHFISQSGSDCLIKSAVIATIETTCKT